MKITVPPEIERALTKQAHKIGTTPELLVLDSLRQRFLSSESEEEPGGEEPRTLADSLDGYIGVLHSSEHVPGGATMSEKSGEKFAANLIRKRDAGRL